MATPRGVISLVLALAAGGVGYAVGSRAVAPVPTEDGLAAENERLKAQIAALERGSADRPSSLAAAPATSAPGGSLPRPVATGTTARPVPAGGTGESVEFPVLTEGVTPDEYVARCFAFLEAQLARGPEGHLAILQAIDAHLVKSEELQRLFGSDEDAVRFMYPLLKFAVTHESQVVECLETTFRTMAESPKTFADLDDDTLEVFTEGIAMALPGVVSTERLGTFTGWVDKVLAAPKGSLPKSIEGNRSELGRLKTMWAPPLTAEQALAALAQPDKLPADQLLSILRRLPKEARDQVDLPAVVGPLLETGNWAALRLLEQIPPTPADLIALDRRLIAALDAGRGIHAESYLRATGRSTFEKARSFYDAWGGSPSLVADTYVRVLMQAGAPAAYLRDVAARVRPSDGVRTMLQNHIDVMERQGAGGR